MNKINSYLLLLIFPVFFFLTGYIIKDAGGPYFLNYYDPSYVYLINSLNLMQFSSVGHFDHPGTTVQVLGAIILKLKFLFANSNDEIVKAVFSNPEKYLELINRCFVMLNSLGLFFLGVFIFKVTKNIYTGLLLQLSPFASFQIFYGLVITAPENILIFASMLFIGILFFYIYKTDPENPSLRFIILFGIICGFGTVTKLTFIPLWIIPFILIKKVKNKLIFISSGVLTFLILFLPAISNYKSFAGWIGNLIFNPKIHGTFDAKPFDISLYISNILTVFKQDKLLLIIYFFMLLNIVLSFTAGKIPKDNIRLKKMQRVLIAVFIGITAQILLITKNYLPYTQYYLIPSFMLLVTGLYVSVSIFYEAFKKYFQRITANQIYVSLTLLLTVLAVILVIDTYKDAVIFSDEAFKIRNMIKNDYKNELVIPSFMTANDDCALALTVFHDYGGSNNKRYTDMLAEMLPTEIYYIAWTNSFFTIPGNVDIAKKIREHKKIIVQLFVGVTPVEKFTDFLKKNYNIDCINPKEILTNKNGESIYEFEIK